ncbi:hypothetical protein [Rummeliibacillus pycnus]|uniref:hypothetical protein n=1 Tax=Rummeliibacillus pycnus TaxID=101070 RepID=UPI0037CB45A7
MSDLQKIVARIPIGITPVDLELLKKYPKDALELIKEVSVTNDNSIAKTDFLDPMNVYHSSVKNELERIKGILESCI